MLFLDDWCHCVDSSKLITLQVNCTAADVEAAANSQTHDLAATATRQVATYLGSKPAFCLSGGIDSQAAYQLWDKQWPIDVVIFEFANGLNSDEVKDAEQYARACNVDYKKITLDVERFLNFSLIDFSQQHNITSPQFAVHAFFLEHLKKLGYTGAVFGGNGFVIQPNKVYFNLNYSQLMDLENYSNSGFNVIPSFLNVSQGLCLKLAVNTAINHDAFMLDPDYQFLPADHHIILNKESRYQNKINSYENLGLMIIPQSGKKTGFEQLKVHCAEVNKDRWAFERKFRWPVQTNVNSKTIDTAMAAEVKDVILNYCSKLDLEKL